MSSLWLHIALLEARQRVLRVQRMRLQAESARQYGKAWISTSVSILVYRDSFVKQYEEGHISFRATTSIRSQELQSYLGYVA